MKLSEVREVIRQAIAEAKEEKGNGLPKSGGKLVHLKKELDGLKKMKESLGSLQIAEGSEQQFVAEYAHMQKFVTELEKIKMAHAKLAEMLDKQISEVETKVSSETEKVKEMMGLIEKAKAPKEKKEKKEKATAHEKSETKAEEKEEHEADKKKAKDLDEARFEKGEDIGKPGAGFKKVAKAASKEYGSKEAGQKVAGAILKKVLAKK